MMCGLIRKGEHIDDLCIRERIARPNAGYPESEALYSSIKEWEEVWGRSLVRQFCDNCGYCNGACPSCVERGY